VRGCCYDYPQVSSTAADKPGAKQGLIRHGGYVRHGGSVLCTIMDIDTISPKKPFEVHLIELSSVDD